MCRLFILQFELLHMVGLPWTHQLQPPGGTGTSPFILFYPGSLTYPPGSSLMDNIDEFIHPCSRAFSPTDSTFPSIISLTPAPLHKNTHGHQDLLDIFLGSRLLDLKVLEIHQQATRAWVKVHISIMAEPLCSAEALVYEQWEGLRFTPW